ncbi:MAG: 5-oxoprolinase subunit PxpB [Chloroflexota bacterium]|nr:5-oxoprolinase subunit PxpB [Chloroflexota bacterium]
MPDVPFISCMGESGLLVELGTTLSEQTNTRVHALRRTLAELDLAGIVDLVPAYSSLLVRFDPLRLDEHELRAIISRLADKPDVAAGGTTRHVIVPVKYGGEYGPDLEELARLHGLTAEEAVRLHTTTLFQVYFLGFMPGFAYMGKVPGKLATGRLSTPRTAVPAGSVGIAGEQTGVYPFVSPGGWRIIGRTALKVWDSTSESPALFSAGDHVRFAATDEEPAPPPRQGGDGRRLAPTFRVISAGALSTIQDLGRPGHGSLGICQGGAFDRESTRLANTLVGNQEGAALLELTWSGPELLALRPTTIALTGADLGCQIDGRPVPLGVSWFVRAGSSIRFTPGQRGGLRAYLAVAGGFRAQEVLGSASTYLPAALGGLNGRALKTGDELETMPTLHPPAFFAGRVHSLPLRSAGGAGAVTELKFTRFTGTGGVTNAVCDAFTHTTWRVTEQSDRMGSRLRAAVAGLPKSTAGELLSFGVVRGAIQIPPSGEPLLLNVDHQTTGGYPLLGVVAEADWGLVAQLRPGDEVRFTQVSVEQARRDLSASMQRLDRSVGRLSG